MKRNEVLLYCTAWMNIKNIMLGKKKKSDIKGHRFWSVCIQNFHKSQIHMDKIASG